MTRIHQNGKGYLLNTASITCVCRSETYIDYALIKYGSGWDRYVFNFIPNEKYKEVIDLLATATE